MFGHVWAGYPNPVRGPKNGVPGYISPNNEWFARVGMFQLAGALQLAQALQRVGALQRAWALQWA